MAKLTTAGIRRALRAASEPRAGGNGRSSAVKRAISPEERAADKLVSKWMRASGLDTKALVALQKRRAEQLDRAVEKQRKVDSRRAPRRRNPAHASIAAQAGTMREFAAAGGFFPHRSITLAQPRLILAEPDVGIITDSRIAPFDSSAKIKVDTRKSGINKLNFVYQSQNQNNQPAVIDAVTFVSASGRLHLRQGGTLIPYSPTVMEVRAQLEVLALTEPPTSINLKTVLFRAILAYNKPFFIDGTEDGTVSEGEQLAVTHCTIPAMTGMLIVVSIIVSVDSDFQPGRAVADFSSGNFEIKCPLVVLQLRDQPQKPLSILD